MAENFYTILTSTGKAKLANSAVLGSKVNFKTLKVGDGKGSYYEPSENQTSLVNQVWSGNIGSISVDENNPNWIVIETLIPATIGGFFIREAGIFDEDDDLIAISKLSETYKPVVSEGSIKDLCIKIILEVSNVESVTLKIDPTVIVATKKDILVIESEVKGINEQLSYMKQQQKTYSELAALVADKKLVPGTQYLLTDYATKYLQPSTEVIKKMSVERLVLTASSTNSFEVVCSSLDFPQDIIHYHFEMNICEDGTTSRTGFITRRIDESVGISIDAPLDWRKILWVRYTPNPMQYLIGAILTNYSVWTSGAAVQGVVYKAGNALLMAYNSNVPTSATDSNVFVVVYDDITIGMMLGDLRIGHNGTSEIKLQKSNSFTERPTFGIGCSRITFAQGHLFARNGAPNYLHNNVFGNNFSSSMLGSSCYNNTFGNDCGAITFASWCCSNTFMNSCGTIHFESNCTSNYFGKGSTCNSFGSGCVGNTFASSGVNTLGSNSGNNIMGGNSWGNTFGANCVSNIFGNSCISNTFATSCTSNKFLGDCGANTFGSGCSSNTFNFGCWYNNFGSNCASNTFANSCGSNSFGATCYSNTFGISCSNNCFAGACHNNSFGANSVDNTLGADCFKNTLGINCSHNTFGSTCCENNIGNDYVSNSHGSAFYQNTMGNGCAYNQFAGQNNGNNIGNSCIANMFGPNAYGTTMNAGCTSNSIGANSWGNTFAASCVYNFIESACYQNSFGQGCQGNHISAYSPNNTFGDSCCYNELATNCHHNTFGTTGTGNFIGPTSQYNIFGNNKKWLHVKLLVGKNLSSVTALESRGSITNIEPRADGVSVYWSLNNSNVPVYTVIA